MAEIVSLGDAVRGLEVGQRVVVSFQVKRERGLVVAGGTFTTTMPGS